VNYLEIVHEESRKNNKEIHLTRRKIIHNLEGQDYKI